MVIVGFGACGLAVGQLEHGMKARTPAGADGKNARTCQAKVIK